MSRSKVCEPNDDSANRLPGLGHDSSTDQLSPLVVGTASLDNSVLLKVEDVMAWLSVSRSTLNELIQTRQLESCTIGRARRIPVGAVRCFVEGLNARSV